MLTKGNFYEETADSESRISYFCFIYPIPLFCFAQIEATINTELANRLVAADVQSKVFVALSKDDWEMFWNIYQQEPRIVNLSFSTARKYPER